MSELVDWICVNMHAFAIVEEKGFLNVIQYLKPNARIVRANTIRNKIQEKYVI